MHIDNVIFLSLSKFAYTKFYVGPNWSMENGLASLTVTCAPCDEGMYQVLGFDARLGATFAHII